MLPPINWSRERNTKLWVSSCRHAHIWTSSKFLILCIFLSWPSNHVRSGSRNLLCVRWHEAADRWSFGLTFSHFVSHLTHTRNWCYAHTMSSQSWPVILLFFFLCAGQDDDIVSSSLTFPFSIFSGLAVRSVAAREQKKGKGAYAFPQLVDHALKEKKLFMVHNSGNKRKRTVSGYSSKGRILICMCDLDE